MVAVTRGGRWVGVAALVGACAACFAGDLLPPAGPVAPTFKTLSELEPRVAISATNTPGDADSLFKITQPGSYYLTGNVTGVAGKHGIEIAASGVTVDLGGFDVAGVPGMGFFAGVVSTTSGLRNISIINGSVRNWGGEGINVAYPNATSGRVESISLSGNGGEGMWVGACFVVSNCAAAENLGRGIRTGVNCTVVHCSAWDNSSGGFAVETASSLSSCSASVNGITGIQAGDGCTITDCISTDSSWYGINASSSTIVRCTAKNNTLSGIRVGQRSTVQGNTCIGNGAGAGDGAGFLVQFDDNRVEGNNCTGNDRGIDVDGSGNVILRNTCSGNTNNWDVVAGNVCLVVNATASGAISGNSGGVAPGSTDPNANFTY